MHSTGRILTGLLAAAFLFGWAAGCGKAAQTVTEEATEKAIEKSIAKDGGTADVKFDSKAGTMQMKGTDASGNTFEMKTGGDKDAIDFKQVEADGTVTQMGANAKLPADFPKDAPVPDGLQLQMVQVSPANKEFMVQGKAAIPLAQAAAFYKEKAAAQGWKETTSMDGGEMQSLVYEKDARMLSVMLMKEGDGTTVSLQLGPK
jgi:hypothetical protein